jgi:hypothetical protein
MAFFWVAAPCSKAIALTMVSESTSETSVNFYLATRSDNPEDSHFHAQGFSVVTLLADTSNGVL